MGQRTSKKILLVEDNPVAQLAGKHLLTEAGFLVETASDGKTAIMMAKQKRYDVILLDIGLPDIRGLAVAEAVREWELVRQLLPTRIVILTANYADFAENIYPALLIDTVWIKPMTEDVIQTLHYDAIVQDGTFCNHVILKH